jgi:hypothetical protein
MRVADLSGIFLDCESVQLLAKALSTNSTLTTLNLAGNHSMGALGAIALCAALLENEDCALSSLNLSDSISIDSMDGANALASLIRMSSMRSLIVWGIRVEKGEAAALSSEVASKFSESLRATPGLTSLDVSFSDLDYASCMSIAVASSTAGTMRYLNLSANKLSRKQKATIRKHIHQQGRRLSLLECWNVLDLEWNGIQMHI